MIDDRMARVCEINSILRNGNSVERILISTESESGKKYRCGMWVYIYAQEREREVFGGKFKLVFEPEVY